MRSISKILILLIFLGLVIVLGVSADIPPAPTTLQNNTGNFWVNYSWSEGSGSNVTNSYNVSINGSWTNATSATFNNSTVGPHGYAKIIVYAFNSSGAGNISINSLIDNVTVPNNPINITNGSAKTVNESENVYVDFEFDDNDTNEIGTFSCNKTDLFDDFDTETGQGNWTTNYTSAGTYYVDFGVSDGYDSIDNYTMTITVNDVSYPLFAPDNLQNDTGNFWVNYTWEANSTGNNTDSYNVSINGSWTNGTTATFNNSSVGPHGYAKIIVYAFNTSGPGTLSVGNLTDNVTVPNNPINITNGSAKTVNESENVYVDFEFDDNDTNEIGTFSCNKTDLFDDFDTETGQGNWTTNYTSAGTYYVDFGVSDGYDSIDNYTMTITVNDVSYPLFAPDNLQNDTGNFWVNYTWEANSTGNNTDSYNVSINGSWTNGTTATFNNSSVGPHGYAKIIVYAFNTSGPGTLSVGNLTDNVTVPNNPINITNGSAKTVNESENVYVDFEFDDNDTNEIGTFSCNKTDLFDDFDTETGQGNWTTNYTSAGTYYVDFGVSDGYDSIDNYTMTITVNDVSYPLFAPDNLQNDTGNFWVNYTWEANSTGNNTDSYNVSINGSWTNGTTATFNNSSVGPHGYAKIIVYAFNTSGPGTLSVGNLTDNVTVPNNPINITNGSAKTVNESENVYVDFNFEDNDTNEIGTFSCNKTDLFDDFDTATGQGNWTTNYTSNGTYYVDFGVSDGYDSTDNYTMTITVNDVEYPPPVISNVNNDTASNNSVTIYWDTDIPSDSLVKYGIINNILNLTNETNASTLVTNHYIVLTGLENETQYFYVVNSTSAFDKSNQSEIKTFNTTNINDSMPPVINDKSLSKTSSVKSDETLTVTINVTDNIGVTLVTANGNINLTRQNATHWNGTITADSTKKVDIIAYDAAGNINTTTITYTLYVAPPSNGGGGGGGGGGASGEAYENIVCTETDRQYIGKDLNVKYNFTLECNYVQHIEFTGLTSAGKVAAKVEMLNHTSTTVDKDAPDIVFKNLNVWVGNMGYFSENNVKDPTITFKVNKSWVNDNDIILNTISFYSHNDDTKTWEKMSTQKIGEDSTSYQFKASLPIRGTLGPMAISGKELVYIPTPVPTPIPTPVITPTLNITENLTLEITSNATPVTWTGTWKANVPGFQVLAALIALITLYFISRRRD